MSNSYKIQPVWGKYLKFLSSFDNDLGILEEGFFWITKSNIIVGFDEDMNQQKLCKVKTNNDLSVSLVWYKHDKITNFLTWDAVLYNETERIRKLEEEAVQKSKGMFNTHEAYKKYCLTSTGKDSCVVKFIIDMCGEETTVFNNTSLDCSETYKIVNSHKDWVVTNPKEGFYQWRERLQFVPTRFSRACCGYFKEECNSSYFSNVENAVWCMGIRHEESANRQDRNEYDKNPKWGDRDWVSFSPILDWTEFDVWIYILKNNLEINEKYKMGYRRVGCAVACPYYTKSTWALDKYWYPKMYDRWHNILENDFVDNKKWVQMNCTLSEYHTGWNGGQVREQPTEQVVKEFAKYKEISEDLARKYFVKTCKECGKRILRNDDVAMNLKINGRNCEYYLCKNCMMKKLNITKQEYVDMIEGFKEQDCKLF